MIIVQIGPFPLSGQVVAGGIESSVSGLSREQAKTNSVVVIDIPRLGTLDVIEDSNGLTVYRFSNNGRHNEDARWRVNDISKVVSSIVPDICHIHGTGLFSRQMYGTLRKKGIPLILTVHGLAREEKRKALAAHFSLKGAYQYLRQSYSERSLLKMASHLIVDTEYVAETIKTAHGHHNNKAIAVIPQGIDERYYQLSCSVHSRMILSVGAFSWRKGHLFLVKAFELLAESLPDATLIICGTVSDKQYYEKLMNYVQNSPHQNRIAIMKDVPKNNLMDLYAKARIFALHSQEESQGIVLVEAMAAGLPVVATDVGGIPYVIKNGASGLLTKYGDIDAFAKSMHRLLTENSNWEQMSQSARIQANDYVWYRIAERIETVYHSVL